MVESLVATARNGRLSHAYLLHGDNPETLDEFSAGLAKLAGCLSRKKDGAACGRCQACVQIDAGTYPDLFVISPTSKSRKIQIGEGSEDQGTIREFQSFFHLSPSFPGGKKIGIIYDAECMTPSAQNAFLKTLEEPPGNSILILCSCRPRLLLPTIRSRCQPLLVLDNRIRYDLPSSEKFLEALRKLSFAKKGDIGLADSCASVLVDIFSGLRKESEDNMKEKFKERLETLDKIDSSLRKGAKERNEAEAAADYLGRREILLSALHSWFGQLYMLGSGVPLEMMPNPELLAPLGKAGHTIDPGRSCRNLSEVEELLRNLSWNVDESLAIREFCIRIVM